MGEAKRKTTGQGGDRPRLIESQFEGWERSCYAGPLPPDQRREVRAAFFCGVKACLRIMDAAIDNPNGDLSPTEEAVCEAMELELQGFLSDMQDGRA